MIKKILFGLIFLFAALGLRAQTPVAKWVELQDFSRLMQGNAAFKAWKGESLLWPFLMEATPEIPIKVTLESGKARISLKTIKLNPIEADLSAGFCGEAKSIGNFEKVSVPDLAIFQKDNSLILDYSEQWIMLLVEVDAKAKPGLYPIKLHFDQAGKRYSTQANLTILNQALEKRIGFQIDFWQYPNSLAEFHQLKPWSPPHLEHLKTMWRQLDEIHQGPITTYAFWDIYNTRIRELDEMMVQVTKRKDGSFTYNFRNFETYLRLVLKGSPKRQISFHNLFPWNNHFFFWDEESGKIQSIHTAPGSEEYKAYWTPFLSELHSFLESKGWLDQFVIYFDERDEGETLGLIEWIKGLHPEFKIGYSGRFDPSLSSLVYDYSMPVNVVLEAQDLSNRKKAGFKTSLYTSCFETANQPNFLLSSNYLDIYFLVYLAKSRGYDGILRWAYNLWSSDILNSAIYLDVPSGDAHLVYPNGEVSVRYLVLKDALEDIAKLEARKNSLQVREMMESLLPYFLLNLENDRWSRVKAMKNFLND